jgi:hypothetical protein
MGASARQKQMQDNIRSLEMQKAKTVGLASAKSGASGVEGTSSSTMDMLSGLGAEFDRSIKIAKDTASSTGLADKIGAISSLFGGAAGTASGIGQLNNWKLG